MNTVLPSKLPSKPAYSHRSSSHSLTVYAVIAVIVLLVGARFWHLSADFPIGISSKGLAYTDEGWWSRNAVAWLREGSWYIDDGYNTILNLPTVPLMQVLWFKAFGISQTAARSLSVTCSLIVSGLVYAIARRELKPSLAWVAPFIILSSYPVFVYSRVAILEMPMMVFVTLSLWLATLPQLQRNRKAGVENCWPRWLVALVLVGSALSAVLAVLAKTTALFALPMILALSVWKPGSTRQKVRSLLIWPVFLITAYLIYYFFFAQGASPSYGYFQHLNISAKANDSLLDFVKGPLRVLKRCVFVYPILFGCLAFSIALLSRIKAYRSRQLFKIVVLWSGLVLGGFSLSSYAEPRYFVLLIVPIALSVPLTIEYFWARPNTLKESVYIGAVVLSVCIGLARTANYLRTPSYSFINMAQQVEAYTKADPDHSPVLMGHFADSLALAADIKAINDGMGFQTFEYRLENLNPGYYILIGEMKAPLAEYLEASYQVELLEDFDVYENHDYGKGVFLYKLTLKEKESP